MFGGAKKCDDGIIGSSGDHELAARCWLDVIWGSMDIGVCQHGLLSRDSCCGLVYCWVV